MYGFDGYQEYLGQYEEMMKFMMSDTVSDIMSLVITLAFSVFAYIFQGRAMYAVAQRRGIEKPWLAWVPVGNAWLIGCISDQYRYVAAGQVKNKRKLLMWLDIGVCVAMVLMWGVLVLLALQGVDLLNGEYTAASAESYAVSMLGILAICFVLIGLAVAYMIVFYMALWDYYRSCDPQRTKLYFILSVLVNYPQPIFMFICRGKDLGMPPRREALPDVIEMPSNEECTQ